MAFGLVSTGPSMGSVAPYGELENLWSKFQKATPGGDFGLYLGDQGFDPALGGLWGDFVGSLQGLGAYGVPDYEGLWYNHLKNANYDPTAFALAPQDPLANLGPLGGKPISGIPSETGPVAALQPLPMPTEPGDLSNLGPLGGKITTPEPAVIEPSGPTIFEQALSPALSTAPLPIGSPGETTPLDPMNFDVDQGGLLTIDEAQAYQDILRGDVDPNWRDTLYQPDQTAPTIEDIIENIVIEPGVSEEQAAIEEILGDVGDIAIDTTGGDTTPTLDIPENIGPRSGWPQEYQEQFLAEMMPLYMDMIKSYPSTVMDAYSNVGPILTDLLESQLHPAMVDELNQLAQRGIIESTMGEGAMADVMAQLATPILQSRADAAMQAAGDLADMFPYWNQAMGLSRASTDTSVPYELMLDFILPMFLNV